MILALDQARHGGWSVWDSESCQLCNYGAYVFDGHTHTFERAVVKIEELVGELIHTHNIGAVYLEDIQLRRNVMSFKRLAQLQGVLVNLCEKNEYQYGLIAPTQWQSFCGITGKSVRETRMKMFADGDSAKAEKAMSMQFARDHCGVCTDDDNLSDAICIGYYVVNKLLKNEVSLDEKGRKKVRKSVGRNGK